MKKVSPKKHGIFHYIYHVIHVISVMYGSLLLFLSALGILIFFHDPSFRVTQLVAMIVSVIDSIALLVPVHKTQDTKHLARMYYSLTATSMLTAGLLIYPVYVITFIILLAKLMITSLRLFAILRIRGEIKMIRTFFLRGTLLLIVIIILSTQGMRWLVQTYGRKIPSPDKVIEAPAPPQKPNTPLPDLGFPIPGKPTRIWKTATPPYITIIDTQLAGTGGQHGTLYMHDGSSLIKLTQVMAVEFADGRYSVGNFGTPVISPDRKYLFIEEQGYEGGLTHAFMMANGKALDRNAYPSAPGVMHWSEGGKCILGELYEYGDRQALQLGIENGNGYTMYPYDQSVITAMGMEDLSVYWMRGDSCRTLLTFTSGITVNPKGLGEDLDEEIIFDMEKGPVRRNRWIPLFDFQSSQKSTAVTQIYP